MSLNHLLCYNIVHTWLFEEKTQTSQGSDPLLHQLLSRVVVSIGIVGVANSSSSQELVWCATPLRSGTVYFIAIVYKVKLIKKDESRAVEKSNSQDPLNDKQSPENGSVDVQHWKSSQPAIIWNAILWPKSNSGRCCFCSNWGIRWMMLFLLLLVPKIVSSSKASMFTSSAKLKPAATDVISGGHPNIQSSGVYGKMLSTQPHHCEGRPTILSYTTNHFPVRAEWTRLGSCYFKVENNVLAEW